MCCPISWHNVTPEDRRSVYMAACAFLWSGILMGPLHILPINLTLSDMCEYAPSVTINGLLHVNDVFSDGSPECILHEKKS